MQHDGLRAQKPPLPGVRPGSLLDPGPQRSDRTVRHSAGDTPLLVVPALRGDDGVDGTTLRFLLKQTLALQKKEEEERRRKELEDEDRSVRESLERAQRFLDRAASKRKRKKRKKKKTSQILFLRLSLSL